MKIGLLFLSIYCFSLAGSAQNVSLLQEASGRLKNGEKLSAILTDQKYFIIHPLTDFRELIKEHSIAEILKITPNGEPGKMIRVVSSVKDKEGKPVAGALVYLYQTDAKGWYAAEAPHVLTSGSDIGHARLFGYVRTDADGQFELHTVKPSGYPKSDLPAHIHFHVMANGFRNFGNEFLFDDDERLIGEIRTQSIRNGFMISKPEPAPKGFEQQFSYKIILDKN